MSAESEKGEGRHQRGSCSQQRAAHGLTERILNDFAQSAGRIRIFAPQHFSNAVEDDNSVVERVADNGQQSGHDVQVYFLIEENENAGRGGHVEQETHHGSGREGQPEFPAEAQRQGHCSDDAPFRGHSRPLESGHGGDERRGDHGRRAPALFKSA